jgi:hypothetical protein
MPVQVSILEATERKLLPIPETKDPASETMIQDCIKGMKAGHETLSNAEILQKIRTRFFELQEWSELKTHQKAAIIGITNNLFVIYPDKLIERLLLQLDRNLPRGVALNLRAIQTFLGEGYFDPKDIPDRDTPSAQIRLASTFIQDLLDRQELESTSTTDSTSSTSSDNSDWELLAELPIPLKNYKDYIL